MTIAKSPATHLRREAIKRAQAAMGQLAGEPSARRCHATVNDPAVYDADAVDAVEALEHMAIRRRLTTDTVPGSDELWVQRGKALHAYGVAAETLPDLAADYVRTVREFEQFRGSELLNARMALIESAIVARGSTPSPPHERRGSTTRPATRSPSSEWRSRSCMSVPGRCGWFALSRA